MVDEETRERVILLCGRGCCPKLRFDGELLTIEDDFGGKVKITREFIPQLQSALERMLPPE